MSGEHSTTLNGREIRYFDVYEANHLELYREAQREGKLCMAVGPTGTGKTSFFDFAVAFSNQQEVQNVFVYDLADIQRAINSARQFEDRCVTAAFFLSRMTWRDVKNGIDVLLDARLGARLAGIEITLDPEHFNKKEVSSDVLGEIRRLASEQNWWLLEFPELNEAQRYRYAGWITGRAE